MWWGFGVRDGGYGVAVGVIKSVPLEMAGRYAFYERVSVRVIWGVV